jgi:hypothetical protein
MIRSSLLSNTRVKSITPMMTMYPSDVRTKQRVKVINGEAECYSCGEFYPLDSEFFYRNAQNKSGYRHQCKSCVSIERKLRDEKHIQNTSKSTMSSQSIGHGLVSFLYRK